MINKIFLTLSFLSVSAIAFAQAKKPTFMVIPTEAWCYENDFSYEVNNQGRKTRITDYEKAFQESSDLLNATTKIGELMADRGFPLKDMLSSIRDIDRMEAENEMTQSSQGSMIAETPLERLMTRAKADIMVELGWKVNSIGPKKSITYTLRGIDAYTNKQVAAAQGTGSPSLSAEIPLLLQEAVVANMDNFLLQLQAHFDDLVTNGREVSIICRIFDNGSGLNFEKEYNGDELTDIIDNWMYDNTVNHRYSLTDAGESKLSFEQVRIPLYRENGRAMDTRSFATVLRRFLSSTPYNIPVKVITKGLGRVELILGEK